MTEYIERRALIDELDKHPERYYFTVINEQPAADVEPVVHGEYVVEDGDSSCSVCGEEYLNITKKRCPNCGAYLSRKE